jgi:hypothetical protein
MRSWRNLYGFKYINVKRQQTSAPTKKVCNIFAFFVFLFPPCLSLLLSSLSQLWYFSKGWLKFTSLGAHNQIHEEIFDVYAFAYFITSESPVRRT